MDQFPNFYKDLKKMIDDKKELEVRDELFQLKAKDALIQKSAKTNSNIKTIIINHYNNIITEAQIDLKEQSKMKALAIKSVPQQEFFKVR
jgi:hypothetical protein